MQIFYLYRCMPSLDIGVIELPLKKDKENFAVNSGWSLEWKDNSA